MSGETDLPATDSVGNHLNADLWSAEDCLNARGYLPRERNGMVAKICSRVHATDADRSRHAQRVLTLNGGNIQRESEDGRTGKVLMELSLVRLDPFMFMRLIVQLEVKVVIFISRPIH